MKIKIIYMVSLLFFFTGVGYAEFHVWKMRSGATLEAQFVQEKNGVVFLKTKDGKTRTVRTSKLVFEDQKRVKQLSSPFKKKKVEKKAPSVLEELFGKKILDHRKKKVDVSVLADKKLIGIYFSAHWCPYCVKLTPKLIAFRAKLLEQNKSFEVVFVSADSSKSDMYRYMKKAKMPWYVVPYKNKYAKKLMKRYSIKGLPTLVIINAKGQTVFPNGTGYVSSWTPERSYKFWIQKAKKIKK